MSNSHKLMNVFYFELVGNCSDYEARVEALGVCLNETTEPSEISFDNMCG